MKQLDLDCVYTKVKRDGKYRKLRFTDLTSEEKMRALSFMSRERLIHLCLSLNNRLSIFDGSIDAKKPQK